MSYYIHDISDTDRIYQFKKEQLENVDCMEMINLHDRGATSEYTLPMDMQKGKQLTIINRDFGVDYDDYYCGVEIILNLDKTQDRASYFFYFKNQSASFVFNGSFWIPLFPKPLPIPELGFFDNTMLEYGYLDLQDYLHPDRKELFGNLDLKNFDVTNLLGRFFRQGKFGTLQEDQLGIHNHKLEDHNHGLFHIHSNPKKTKKADTTQAWNNWGFYDCFRIESETKTLNKNQSIMTDHYGSTETRPKNIQGQYIVKAW